MTHTPPPSVANAKYLAVSGAATDHHETRSASRA